MSFQEQKWSRGQIGMLASSPLPITFHLPCGVGGGRSIANEWQIVWSHPGLGSSLAVVPGPGCGPGQRGPQVFGQGRKRRQTLPNRFEAF